MNEVYQEESEVVRRARLNQMDKEEREARAAQIEAASAQTRGQNEAYFEKQAALQAQIAKNKPVTLAPKTNEQAAKDNAERYPYAPHYPKAHDPLLDREPQYVRDAMNYHPAPLKPSLKLKPQPDPRALAEYLGKKPQPEMATILDAAHPIVVDTQIRILPTGPTTECPNCGTEVSKATAWHRLPNGTPCVLPGGEAQARRDGIVVPDKPAPKSKLNK